MSEMAIICIAQTTPTNNNILGVITKEVELDPMARDERNEYKMH